MHATVDIDMQKSVRAFATADIIFSRSKIFHPEPVRKFKSHSPLKSKNLAYGARLYAVLKRLSCSLVSWR